MKPTFQTLSLTFILIGAILFFFIKKYAWEGVDGKGYTRIIGSDGKGYYMYLPNIFITKDIDHQPVDKRERFLFNHHGREVNKYFAGTAVCMAPFFWMAYLESKASHVPVDGYESPFQKAM